MSGVNEVWSGKMVCSTVVGNTVEPDPCCFCVRGEQGGEAGRDGAGREGVRRGGVEAKKRRGVNVPCVSG